MDVDGYDYGTQLTPPDISFFVEAMSLPSPTMQPMMGFTPEENHLVQKVIDTEAAATATIPVSPMVLQTMVMAARTGGAIPYSALVEGYTVCMKRIVKLASQLDFFQSFEVKDRKTLLLNNTDMVVNIRSARLLRPGHNLQAQLVHIVGGDGAVSPDSSTSDVATYQKPPRIEYRQIYQSPWAEGAEHEEKFASLMENLFHLEMDRTTTILMTLVVLFASNEKYELIEPRRAEQNRQFFSRLLHRYLVFSVGRPNAERLMPEYMALAEQLKQMAEIMMEKRLTF